MVGKASRLGVAEELPRQKEKKKEQGWGGVGWVFRLEQRCISHQELRVRVKIKVA
jgi:hypothetical protein